MTLDKDNFSSAKNLYAYNRKLDPQCERYFFVAEPIQLKVKTSATKFGLPTPETLND